MAERVWITKDGQRIPIAKMTDQHLRNSVRFMRKACDAGAEYVRTLRLFDGQSDPTGLERMTESNETLLGKARRLLSWLEEERRLRATYNQRMHDKFTPERTRASVRR